jgi:hypothetical protein
VPPGRRIADLRGDRKATPARHSRANDATATRHLRTTDATLKRRAAACVASHGFKNGAVEVTAAAKQAKSYIARPGRAWGQ